MTMLEFTRSCVVIPSLLRQGSRTALRVIVLFAASVTPSVLRIARLIRRIWGVQDICFVLEIIVPIRSLPAPIISK